MPAKDAFLWCMFQVLVQKQPYHETRVVVSGESSTVMAVGFGSLEAIYDQNADESGVMNCGLDK
jgi:hypothetical protein